MSLWLVIGVGGFIGAILRFIISGWIQNGVVTFPLGTLGVQLPRQFFCQPVAVPLRIPGILQRRNQDLFDDWRPRLLHYHVHI